MIQSSRNIDKISMEMGLETWGACQRRKSHRCCSLCVHPLLGKMENWIFCFVWKGLNNLCHKFKWKYQRCELDTDLQSHVCLFILHNTRYSITSKTVTISKCTLLQLSALFACVDWLSQFRQYWVIFTNVRDVQCSMSGVRSRWGLRRELCHK